MDDIPSHKLLIEMIGGITKLDFRGSRPFGRGINAAQFSTLVHLPFTHHLTHLYLPKSHTRCQDDLVTFLTHPIFQYLVTLDASGCNLTSLDPFFNAPHPFPNLHTLKLDANSELTIPNLATMDKFPNLKVLELESTNCSWDILLPPPSFPPAQQQKPPHPYTTTTTQHDETMPIVQTTSSFSPIPHPFQLHKLTISSTPSWWSDGDFKALSTSPHLSQLTELKLNDKGDMERVIDALFGSKDSVVKNLTTLDFVGVRIKTLEIIAKSRNLTNLTNLSIQSLMRRCSFNPLVQSLSWLSPKLKHLTLHIDIPPDSFITELEEANVQLETFNLPLLPFDCLFLTTSPVFSQLKVLVGDRAYLEPHRDVPVVDHPQLFATAVEQLSQSPILSNLTHFRLPKFALQVGRYLSEYSLTPNDLESILTSPMMSNNLIELDFAKSMVTDQLIETILTTRVIPGDETSPLKFGQLQKLNIQEGDFGTNAVNSLVKNLTQLTHLNLSGSSNIDDAAITALIGPKHTNLQLPSPSLPNLRDLALELCQITDKGCGELSKSQLIHRLGNFSCRHCFQVTDVGEGMINKSMNDPI